MNKQQKIEFNDVVESEKKNIFHVLQNMVRIPSVTHPPGGDEGRVQEYISQLFIDLGLDVDIFEPTQVQGITDHEGYWPGLDYTDRPNVVGVWKGVGGGRNIILNGHCDVVPEGPEEYWSDKPFSGLIKQNRLYGRGSVDMKGGITAMLMAVKCLQKANVRLKGDVILESVVNEELGGYNGTLACIVKGYEADAAIVTEPTNLKISPATKGGQAYRIVVHGESAHTSFWWEGVSSLDKAILIKKAIEDFANQRQKETRNNLHYSDSRVYPISALTDCVYSFNSGDPNIMGVPQKTTMELMIDVLPGESLDQVKIAFENCIKNLAASDNFMKDHPPIIERANMRDLFPTQIDVDHPIISSLESSHEFVLQKKPIISGFESACDAMMFNLFSKTPAVVFGPGQLKLAHRPDEYMDLTQLILGVKILGIAIADFCGVDV